MSELRGKVPGPMDAMADPEFIPSEYLQKWQSLVDLMAKLCEVPAGLIMRTLPSQIEVLIASHSAGNPYVPHHKADLGTGLYCETVMKSGEPLLVPNALEDLVWNTNPDLELGMIAYLGIPLYWDERELFGTICVLDDKTRKFAAKYVDLLWHFKDVIESDCRQIQRTRTLEVEQAQLQEVFLRNEQQHRQFFESFPGMAMLVSDAGRCLAINQRGGQMVDRPADAICGAHLREVLTDAGWATLAPLVGRAVSGEAIIEDVGLPLLGSCRRVQVMCVPHDDVASGLKGTYLFVVDQEGQKAAEEALSLSEARLQETQAIAQLGMWELDLVRNRLMWSDETFRIFEHDRARVEPSYEVFINGVHPDDRARVNDAFGQSLETRTPYEIVHRLQMPDGRIKYVQCRSQTFFDDEGRPQRVMGTVQDITARKRIEEALGASEERFRAAYRNATVGMSFADQYGRIHEVNQALCTILGYSEQELLTLTFQAVTHPDDLDHSLDRVRGLLAGKATYEVFEKRYIRKDGSIVWVQVGISLIRDAAGLPLYFLTMVQDITNRKQAEEALLASQRRFDLAVEGSQTGIWDWDIQANRAYFSPPWKQQLGYEDHELPSLPEEWYARQHPDDRAHVAETLRAYLDGETEQYEIEHRLRHKDGSYRWILARGVALRDAQGKPTRMAGSHVDITDRKRMELALLESEERFNYVTEATNDGIWDWDIQTGRVYFSPQWLRLLEYVPEEVSPSIQSFFTLVHPDDAARMTQVLHAHMDNGHLPVMELELRLRTKSGAYRWFLDRGKVVTRGQDGTPLRMVGTITDITDRKQAEQALRLTRFSIEHAVDAVLWLAVSGRILDVNEAACVMLGYTREELLSKTVHDIGLSVSAEAWSAHWDDAKARTSLSFESECRKKDGTVIQIEKTVNFLIHEGEEYNCAFIRDITESKQAQSRLRATQYAIDHATDSLFVINLNGQFVDVNESACIGLGYTKEELLTKTVMDIDPDWSLIDLQTFWEEFRYTKFIRLETRHRTKSGVVYPVEIVANFIVHEGQELNYAFVRDISVRKKAEAFAEAQRTVLGLMAKDAPLSDILACLCLETEKQSAGMLCSVLLLEGTVLCHAVAPSLPDEYTSAINGVTIGPEVGSCGAAAYKNETVIVADIATDPLWDDYREMALREGLKTCWSTPIRDAAGSVLGVFAVYRRTAVAPDAAQEELINMSVYLAGIAIERRRAEESLRLVKFSVDHATDAMYWVGSGAELLDVNETACSMLGYTKEEFSQMTVLDINPNLHERPWPIRWEETSRKGTMSMETTHRTKDGRLIPVEVRVNVLNYQGVECHCAFVRDITLRKLAEEELRRNEELFRVAYHNAAVGMAICDLHGRFLEINPAFCEILGYSEEELRERDFTSVTYPADMADSVNWVHQVVDGQIAQKLFEKRYVRKSGEIVWGNLGLSVIRDGAGAVVKILAMVQDTTARKKAEQVLRASEQRLIEAQSVARLGSWNWDISENRHQWSDEQYRILGFAPGSIRPAFEVFANSLHPDDRAVVVETIQAAIHGDAGFDLTCRIVRPDGEIRHVHCRGEVLRSQLGAPISMIGTVQDSTRQKRTEATLRVVASEPARFGETKILGSMLRTLAEGTGAIFAFCGKVMPGGLRVKTVAVWSHGSEAENMEYDLDGTPCKPVVTTSACVHERGVREKFPTDLLLHELGADSYIGTPLFGSDDQPIGLLAIIGAQPFEDAEHAKTLMQICAGRAGSELERRQIEKVLQSSEERFRLVAEATQDILWDWNVVTGEHWWSPNACEKFGYDSRVEWSIDAWRRRLHPEDKERVLTVVDQAIESNARSFSAEYRFQLVDGTYGYFLDRAHIVRNKFGAAQRMIGAMIDVTGPRLAYASLEEAYRRLQAMSQELQMVESNERRRLSRELHDEIGQLLTSLKFDLAAFNRSLTGPAKPVSKRGHERLARALETTDLLFTRLRQVVRALRPPVLEELGLRAGLEALLADVHARTGLRCSLVFEEGSSRAGRFPTLETAFYRIVQELLTNVVRHAKATTVSVTLMPGRQEWRMTVKDNGTGFDVTKLFPTGGFGLRGIRERVEILAGQVEIVSSPESGTSVEVRIPVGQKSKEAPRQVTRALSPRRGRNTVHE